MLQLEVGAAPATHGQAGKGAAAGLIFTADDFELLTDGQLQGRNAIGRRHGRHLSIGAFQRRVEAVCLRRNV